MTPQNKPDAPCRYLGGCRLDCKGCERVGYNRRKDDNVDVEEIR